jgi:CheY-like chemotaxis protein
MNSGGAVSEILLVEDNPNDVELILHVFQWCNLADRIHVAWNGEEALDYLFGTGTYEGKPGVKPKVILLDLKLPKVDGLEVLRKIKGDSSPDRSLWLSSRLPAKNGILLTVTISA